MNNEITYRPAEKSDIGDVVNLINSQYERKYIPEYFYWQYFNSVYPSLLMCAFGNDNQLLGMFGVQQRELTNGAVALQAIDLLIEKNSRGKGIFKALGDKAFESFKKPDMYCVFPNINGKNSIEKSFGWKTLSKIDELVLEISPDIIKEIENSVKKIPLLKNLTGFCYRTDIRLWRFRRHPVYEYKRFEKDIDSAVTKIFVDPVTNKKYGDIAEVEFISEKIFDVLLEAINYLAQNNADYICTWALSHTPLYGVFKSAGFNETARERYFCLKILNEKFNYLHNIENWNLMQADSEIY